MKITRNEFDQLSSDIFFDDDKVKCPDCGQRTTHPYPNCPCRNQYGKHIMLFHHTCKKEDN